jgi:AcrR family transcriptional regulator
MAPDTRERLIAAARAHLDEQGLEGLTLRGIARRAGVSHGAPLRHFPGVDHLLSAVAADGFRGLFGSIVEATAEVPDADGLGRLVAGCRGYVRFALANPGAFELMFRHERHAAQVPELMEAGAAAFLQLVDLVSAAQAQGWHADQHAGALAGVVWASTHGVVSLWLPGTLHTAVAFTGADAELDDLLDLSVRLTMGRDDLAYRLAPRPTTTRRKRS